MVKLEINPSQTSTFPSDISRKMWVKSKVVRTNFEFLPGQLRHSAGPAVIIPRLAHSVSNTLQQGGRQPTVKSKPTPALLAVTTGSWSFLIITLWLFNLLVSSLCFTEPQERNENNVPPSVWVISHLPKEDPPSSLIVKNPSHSLFIRRLTGNNGFSYWTLTNHSSVGV